MMPAEIFNQVSPSIAFVDTEAGSGSGVLIEGNYVVTNAHVVWPFETVRVVFPDGSEFDEAPVLNWDLMGDLAVIGPIDTDIQPLLLVDGEDQVIGSDVYLIGYPGEVEEFPQPAISRGLISRIRQWEPIQMSYFQTDATIAGGQSGGVLVSERAEVIGISGFTFANSEFGLVASAADILPRVERLIQGEDVDELENRQPIQTNAATSHIVTLDNAWDTAVFIIDEPINTTVNLTLDGSTDYAFWVTDVYGNNVLHADDVNQGKEVGEFTTEIAAPYFITVYQNETFSTFANLESNVNLMPYRDRDGVQKLTIGQQIKGNIDYPGDDDTFRISLNKGDVINIKMESVMLDSILSVDIEGMHYNYDDLIIDDDSGGGVFGLDAELSYEAPQDGTYFLNVRSSYAPFFGGYVLTVDEPYEGAPTPSAPLPTPTPIATEFGEMALYESSGYPLFKFQYPADWLSSNVPDDFGSACTQEHLTCFANKFSSDILMILEEDLQSVGLGNLTQEEYGDLYLGNLPDDVDMVSREQFENNQGLAYEIIHLKTPNNLFEAWRLIYLDTETSTGFNVTYLRLLPDSRPDDEELLAMLEEYENQTQAAIAYSLSTLEVDK